MLWLELMHPAALYAATALIGLAVGSFLNVVILRLPPRLFHEWKGHCRDLLELPADEAPAPPGLVRPRSRCPACGAGIAWYDNLPVLSWLLLRGRCRSCASAISTRYPVVELVTAILSVVVIWQLGPTAQGLAGLVFTWTLIAASGIDFDYHLLPDPMTLGLLWLGLLLNLFGLFTDLDSAVIGAIAGYGLLWVVYHLFRMITGREGMGYGDFKLLGAIGAWFGWEVLPLVLLLASLVGALIGIVLVIVRRQGRHIPIAFGPYLAAAGWIAMLWGHAIIDFWMGF